MVASDLAVARAPVLPHSRGRFIPWCAGVLAFVVGVLAPPDAYADGQDSPDKWRDRSPADIAIEIERRLADRPATAWNHIFIAELMKYIGDTQAPQQYQAAIDTDPGDAGAEVAYADYLRNYRGAQHPLFEQARSHFQEALRKAIPADVKTKELAIRGLLSLHEQDGLPLFLQPFAPVDTPSPGVRRMAFGSSGVKYTELDDDPRAFVSDALLASGSTRLNRELTRLESAAIVRKKPLLEDSHRLRLRLDDLPVIDLLYAHRHVEVAAVDNYFDPDHFNSVEVEERGLALEKPLHLYPLMDLFVRGTYKRVEIEGASEFLPDHREWFDLYEGKLNLSRFLGPDKINLELTYAFFAIDPNVPDPPTRERQIVAGMLTYSLLRPLGDWARSEENRFELRGVDFFLGAARDTELFGSIQLERFDRFAGIEFRKLGDFAVRLQGTVYTLDVEDDPAKENSQYRTDVAITYRWKDEANKPGLPDAWFLGLRPAFVHVVFPLRHEGALEGPDEFESFRVGVGLDVKLFQREIGDVSFLLSLRYDRQRFYHLDRDLNEVTASISLGF